VEVLDAPLARVCSHSSSLSSSASSPRIFSCSTSLRKCRALVCLSSDSRCHIRVVAVWTASRRCVGMKVQCCVYLSQLSPLHLSPHHPFRLIAFTRSARARQMHRYSRSLHISFRGAAPHLGLRRSRRVHEPSSQHPRDPKAPHGPTRTRTRTRPARPIDAPRTNLSLPALACRGCAQCSMLGGPPPHSSSLGTSPTGRRSLAASSGRSRSSPAQRGDSHYHSASHVPHRAFESRPPATRHFRTR